MINSYFNLPAAKYKQVCDIIDSYEGNDRLDALMGVLYDTSLSECPVDRLPEYLKAMEFLTKDVPDIKYNKPVTLKDGTVLKPIDSIASMSAAQYIDFQTFIKRYTGVDASIFIMAVCYIPEGKSYNKDYSVFDIAKALEEECSIAVIHGVGSFFLKQCVASIKATLRSSILKMMPRRPMRAMRLLSQLSTIDGSGLYGLTRLQAPLDSTGMMYMTSASLNSSISSATS